MNQFILQCLKSIFHKKETYLLLIKKFIQSLVHKYGKHDVYTDGGTWYPESCNFLNLKHRLHSPIRENADREGNAVF